MTDQSDVRSLGKRRRATLRVFYGFVVAAIAAFTLGVRASSFARGNDGTRDSPRGRWRSGAFFASFERADAHQKLINHEATSFAFVASMLLTLVVGLLQRFGLLLRCLSLGSGVDDCILEHRPHSRFLAVPMKTRLRVLRAEKEWSQAELAETVGVTRQCINAIETGKYEPGLDLAFKIARVFGKNIEEVFIYPGEQGSPSS